jgi:tetratricopeptide (TPR) repeat protein
VNISDKVKEAETYRSMGLLEESTIIYDEILSSEKFLENETRNQYKSTIADIIEELESLKNGQENTVSEEEIAIIRDTLPIVEGDPHIQYSASAFMELGLYKEALSDYEKLLDNESIWKNVLQDLATCLLKCCDPSEIFPTVKEMVARTETNDQNKSEIQFRLGMEMQKRDHKVLAQELCRSAKVLNPDNEEIEKWLNSNSSRQKILSKYDHGFQNRSIGDVKVRLMETKENISDRIPDEAKLFLCITMIVLAFISFVVMHL